MFKYVLVVCLLFVTGCSVVPSALPTHGALQCPLGLQAIACEFDHVALTVGGNVYDVNCIAPAKGKVFAPVHSCLLISIEEAPANPVDIDVPPVKK